MTDIDAIFAANRQHPPRERSLPWPETRDGITVVIEPKPHWAENGARARFFGHVDTCGDDLIRKARALVAGEVADGHWI